ncbi:MAG TPA: FKBP-type peptidyl-prolyl cis-trans isomerase [Ignavibacteriaceae bacterium]|nr:FKBP-type peptidyl-prolyl cis-trans isomerase [Ignavibacteriaceae bacterium]
MKKIWALSLIVLIITGFTSMNAQVQTTPTGVQYQDNVKGSGRVVKEGDLVKLHINGWIIKDSTEKDVFSDWSKDSTKMQDNLGSTKEQGQPPLNFVVGSGPLTPGMEQGIIGMQPGGVRTIIVPPALAYGEAGQGPIPPKSRIKVVIDLLDAQEAPKIEKWSVDTTKYKTTPSGLKYVILKEGTGENPKTNDIVSVHYSGFLTNGKKFDSSVERNDPIKFPLGTGRVIKGWDEGIALLKKGAKAQFVIPPSIAYGERDMGVIPPNSTLIFDVELVDIQSQNQDQNKPEQKQDEQKKEQK